MLCHFKDRLIGRSRAPLLPRFRKFPPLSSFLNPPELLFSDGTHHSLEFRNFSPVPCLTPYFRPNSIFATRQPTKAPKATPHFGNLFPPRSRANLIIRDKFHLRSQDRAMSVLVCQAHVPWSCVGDARLKKHVVKFHPNFALFALFALQSDKAMFRCLRCAIADEAAGWVYS